MDRPSWGMIVQSFWRLAWPVVRNHPLRPWRSPWLRWRLETYGLRDPQGRILSAHDVGPRDFWRFCWCERRALWVFLRWAGSLQELTRDPGGSLPASRRHS